MVSSCRSGCSRRVLVHPVRALAAWAEVVGMRDEWLLAGALLILVVVPKSVSGALLTHETAVMRFSSMTHVAMAYV